MGLVKVCVAGVGGVSWAETPPPCPSPASGRGNAVAPPFSDCLPDDTHRQPENRMNSLSGCFCHSKLGRKTRLFFQAALPPRPARPIAKSSLKCYACGLFSLGARFLSGCPKRKKQPENEFTGFCEAKTAFYP